MAAGLVIIGDIDVFGLNPQTGAIVWRFAPRLTFPDEREFERLTTDGASVYCGGIWGNVYAIDAATGVQRWVSHVTSLPDSAVAVFNPVLAKGVLYVSFSDDHDPRGFNPASEAGAAAFDAATGQLRWSRYLPSQAGVFPSQPEGVALTATRAITVGANGALYALDQLTGTVLDSAPRRMFGFKPTETDGVWYLLAANDAVVVVGVTNGILVGLDALNLQHQVWTTSLSYGSVWDVTIDASRVYVAFVGGQFMVSNLTTGKAIWYIEPFDFQPTTSEAILSAPAIDTDRIYVGADKDVYAFKRQ